MLKELFEKAIGKKVTRVGRVDIALGQALIDNEKEHDAAHNAIREKVEAYIEQVKVEHEPECERLSLANVDIWEQVYDALGLPEHERGASYKMDYTTGIVSKIEYNPQPDFDDEDKPSGPVQ